MKSTTSIMASLPTPTNLPTPPLRLSAEVSSWMPRLPDCDTMLAPPGSGRSSVNPVP